MRWRAARTSARSGTGEAVMPRVYHGTRAAMSQRTGQCRRSIPCHAIIPGDRERSPTPGSRRRPLPLLWAVRWPWDRVQPGCRTAVPSYSFRMAARLMSHILIDQIEN